MGRADADNAELHNSELGAPADVALPRDVLELAELWKMIATAHGCAPAMSPEWSLRIVCELLRLRYELLYAQSAHARAESELAYERRQRAVIEAELAEVVVVAQSIAASDADSHGSALIEAIEIAEAAGRRGLLTNRERERIRALRRAVPS